MEEIAKIRFPHCSNQNLVKIQLHVFCSIAVLTFLKVQLCEYYRKTHGSSLNILFGSDRDEEEGQISFCKTEEGLHLRRKEIEEEAERARARAHAPGTNASTAVYNKTLQFYH